jgi:hypothetical protein
MSISPLYVYRVKFVNAIQCGTVSFKLVTRYEETLENHTGWKYSTVATVPLW